MSRLIKRSRIHWVAPALGALLSSVITPARAADGYWLDQYNALLYLASFQLDRELEQMQRQGAGVVMVHADSLPDPLLRWIAWRARRAQLQPVAWVQRPTVANLRRVGAVSDYQALQVDDHYFADPPVPIERLKTQLLGRSLWCSFQPGQFSWRAARACDHVDLQLYRQSCNATVDAVYRLGIAGARDTAVAVYHDGSDTDNQRLACLRERVRSSGNRLFVFKWKNPEHWLSPITGRLWQGLSRLRALGSRSEPAQPG
jgi:hypothetical protein